MGYTADHAKDGLEVLELCERAFLGDALYDVILLDIQMPNMDVSCSLWKWSQNRDMRQRESFDNGIQMVAGPR
jgi:CheY-like chemotaxis protein